MASVTSYPRPDAPRLNVGHGALCYAVLGRNFPLCPWVGSDRKNIIEGQLRAAMLFSSRASPLRDPVGGVIRVRAKKKMAGIDAGAVIAAMTNVQKVRYLAMLGYPRQPMRRLGATIPLHVAVSIGAKRRHPKEASAIWLGDGPSFEAISKRDIAGKAEWRNKSISHDRVPSRLWWGRASRFNASRPAYFNTPRASVH